MTDFTYPSPARIDSVMLEARRQRAAHLSRIFARAFTGRGRRRSL